LRLSPPSLCARGGTVPVVRGREGVGAARAQEKEEEPEPGEDWEGEERPEEYAGLFDDPYGAVACCAICSASPS